MHICEIWFYKVQTDPYYGKILPCQKEKLGKVRHAKTVFLRFELEDTYPLVPSMGSKTQCRPLGPPSDLPLSMALRTSSVVKVEKSYDPSPARVSFTSSVMRFNVSWPLSLRRSPES